MVVLNEVDPHKLIGNGTTRNSGLIETGVALLEEVCHGGDGL